MGESKEVTIQNYAGWEDFYKIEKSDKLKFFMRNGRMLDILFAQQFDRSFLDSMCLLATRIRRMALTKMGSRKLSSLLSHKRAMLYFVQPSTRTFISFLNACHILGMKISEIRGTTTSSEVKGESQEDTIRTFASYVDLIIARLGPPGHPAFDFAWQFIPCETVGGDLVAMGRIVGDGGTAASAGVSGIRRRMALIRNSSSLGSNGLVM